MRLLFEGGLFLRVRSKCGYYSRAATIRGAATIRVNTVIIHAQEHMESTLILCMYGRAPGQTCLSLSSVVSVARCSLLRTTCISSSALG